MRTFAIAFALLVAGCGHPQSSGTSDPPPPPPAGATGEHGAVCHCSEERGDTTCVAVGCKPGLSCGYGCGIPGCDSTCMTAEELEQSHTIP
jgi:hypothetical protein